jgi:hypothetical protein
MKVVKKYNHLYLSFSSLKPSDFETLKKSLQLSKDIIIDLKNNLKINPTNYSALHKLNDLVVAQGFCMVVVADCLQIDSNVLNIVPTLTEAEDYLQMEQIQRDLGI